MFNFSEGNGFTDILERCLARIPDTLDKRQGSIIYDALAPACAELAQCYIALDVYADQTYLLNAIGENLDNKVYDYGLSRNAATYAKRKGEFTDTEGQPMSIDIGSRWSIPNAYGGYNFVVIEETEVGKYILECETEGTVGNQYFGILLPIDPINNLGEAKLTEIYIAGEDAEDDESLRDRTINKLREVPFGGNIADYRQYVEGLEGIRTCLVIPIWNGGGTVKIVPITGSFEIPLPPKIQEIQTALDPTQNNGEGLGMAPIGHVVTVVAPQEFKINITANVAFKEGFSLSGQESAIKQALKDYLQEVQSSWADEDELTIYIARCSATILTVNGVENVEDLQINGNTENVSIKPKEGENPYPVLGEVTLSEID